ncbi:Fur-regulated basic protein FbpA [Oceanobacillus sojae]|nr:Fur-regulated basic protein FbpA [Oceanobacillus sojae]
MRRYSMSETDVQKRKHYLIKELHRMEIYQTSDGRQLNSLTLSDLEWEHITARCEAARHASY